MIEKGRTAILYVVGFSLCAYLLASLSHVMWVFRLFEPHSPIIWNVYLFQIDARNLEAFSQAVGIDVLTSLLIAFCILAKKRTHTAFMVAIIATLIVYSFLFNFVYAEANSPVGVQNLWNVPLFFGLTTIGAIIPLMVSAYPLFILAYTFLAIFIRGVQEISVEELRKRADELEAMQTEKDRIAALKKQTRVTRVKGGIDTASEVWKHLGDSFSRKREEAASEPDREEGYPDETVQATSEPPSFPVQAITESIAIPESLASGNGHQTPTPVSRWDALPLYRPKN